MATCPPEGDLLSEVRRSAPCNGTYLHKVSLVLDNSFIEDGTFNQLAHEGAQAACTAAASCCLEADILDDDDEDLEVAFFCEVEYAAQDSNLTIGVGFLHEQSVHRAATCMPHRRFSIVDVACTPGCHAGLRLEPQPSSGARTPDLRPVPPERLLTTLGPLHLRQMRGSTPTIRTWRA